MKTLFFVAVGILLCQTTATANEDDPFLKIHSWRLATPSEFPGSTIEAKRGSLNQPTKLLHRGAKMNHVVSACGLPDGEYDPTTMPHPGRGIALSGGIIYRDGMLLGHEEDLSFRYDLPDTTRVYITTRKDWRVEGAFLYSTTQGFKSLIK